VCVNLFDYTDRPFFNTGLIETVREKFTCRDCGKISLCTDVQKGL
jgi:hypothetical protein